MWQDTPLVFVEVPFRVSFQRKEVPSALVIESNAFFGHGILHFSAMKCRQCTMSNKQSNLIKPSLCLSHPLLDWERWTISDVFGDIVRSSRLIGMGNLCFGILCQCCYNLLIQTSNWCSTHLVSPWNLKCFVSVKCGWFLCGSEFPPWARIMP